MQQTIITILDYAILSLLVLIVICGIVIAVKMRKDKRSIKGEVTAWIDEVLGEATPKEKEEK